MKELKIKVCGMRISENIDHVCAAGPDYLGFIFYSRSARFVGEHPDPAVFSRVPPHIRKVGVFVNEEKGSLLDLCRRYDLFAAQLHGNEGPEYCRDIKENGFTVIKAVALDEMFDFSSIEKYGPVVDYFLFDTRGKLPGGNGQKFSWPVLKRYKMNIPFFLSGGIGPADTEALKGLDHPQFFALDINSGFEIEPAVKDALNVAGFIHKMKNLKT